MTNIFLHDSYNKLINNLVALDISDIKMIKSNRNNLIYKYHYIKKIDVYIFCSTLITKEISDFINDPNKNSNPKYIIYHDKFIPEIFNSEHFEQCTHILNEEDYQNVANNKKTIMLPKHIINNDIYDNINHETQKQDSIVVFLDKYDIIPKHIEKHLYPNSNKKIRMFNSNVVHEQNIGFTTEIDKAELLKNSKYFFCDQDDYYLLEANKCKCCIITDLDTMKEYSNPIVSEYHDYKNFLRKILNET